METTYCVRRIRWSQDAAIVRGLQTLAEALEAAVLLYELQQAHGGDHYDFCVEAE